MAAPMGRAKLVVAAAFGLLLVACGGGTASAPTPSSTPKASPTPAAAAVLATKTVTVAGKSETVLADGSNGLTLYYFTPDKGGKVTCAGQCAVAWPPLMLPSGMSKANTPSGVTGTVGTVAATSGGMQVTYNGWPLYTYVQDKDKGDVYGQGVGGKWYVAALDIPSSTT